MIESRYNEHRHKKELRKIAVLTSLGSTISNFLDYTCKFKLFNHSKQNEPAIYAIYHGWQYILGGVPNRKNLHILISQSNDGEIIARIVHNLGFSTIRGSMGRGGMKATREILKALEDGKNIAYTVDGPKGPGFKVKNGIIKIAQMAQRPIIPAYGDAPLRIEINSWDKYQIPLPFNRIPLSFGEPIVVPEGDENIEEYRLKLENELMQLKNSYRQK